jgi:hypothetical protein
LCYTCSATQRIGVRELRQQASRYLARVQAEAARGLGLEVLAPAHG